MPYKWIADEIERLDPEVDYERIWKLSTTYWVDDFQLKKVLPDPKLSTPERKRRKLSRKPGFRAPQHKTVDTGLGVT
jgi:hypothetical protein